MKDNTALYIGGGILALLVLPKLLDKEDGLVPGLMPGAQFDFGDMFAGLGLGDTLMNLPALSFDMPNLNIQDAIDKALAGITGLLPDMPTIPGIGDLIPDMPGEGYLGFVQETIGQIPYVAPGLGAAGGLATAYAARGLPAVATGALRGTLSTLAPRVATVAGVGLGLRAIPVIGWAYLAADVGTTIYEAVTGQGVAGAWLGQGELLGLTRGGEVIESGNVPEGAIQTEIPLGTFLEDSPMIPSFMLTGLSGVWETLQGIFGFFSGGQRAEAQGLEQTIAEHEAGWGIAESPSISEGGTSLVLVGAGTPSAPAPFAPSGGIGEGGGGWSAPSFSGLGGEEGAIAWA